MSSCEREGREPEPAGSDDGTWYFLNSNYLGVAFDKSHNFTVGDFVMPENQDAKTALILCTESTGPATGASWRYGGINNTITS